VHLDDIDHAIIRALVADARLPNNALAGEVGIAPSTCHLRVRRLRDLGVIRGFHADIDPATLGLPIQAMISVRLQAHARSKIEDFAGTVAQEPQVLNVYFLAGPVDFLLHVVADSPDGLRRFVVDLSSRAAVAHTETSLIFEHLRAAGVASGAAPA
jgi:DNA-binding Lrp family transcriptional regulator